MTTLEERLFASIDAHPISFLVVVLLPFPAIAMFVSSQQVKPAWAMYSVAVIGAFVVLPSLSSAVAPRRGKVLF